VEKTDNPLMIFENYPFTARGWYLPAFVGRTIGESINETKGISKGEDIWLSFGRDFDTKDIGFNHFQVYFTARMYWGGPEQDVDAMLEEYCRLFYGPAGDAIRDFFTYCEDHWQEMEQEKPKVDMALTLFAAAKSKVPPDSVYAKRLGLIDDFLSSLRSKSEQLAKKRGPVPKLRMVWDAEEIVIDGRLDDEYWQNCPTAATCSFRELQTGRKPIYGTTVKSGWHAGNLYFAIRCDEQPGEPLNIGTTKRGDQAIWYGDVVEILLETDSHSYYQFAINPAGVLLDLDRGASKQNWYRWESQAEVATHVADDHWAVEIRIPVTDDENDPLNQVVGRKPSASLPWSINLCRQRIRDNGSEYSAFSPTGTKSFHKIMKFAHFYDGRSRQFDADEPDDDYLHARRTAEKLKREEALEAFVALAHRPGLTDFQKCDALQQAAAAARSLKNYDRAEKLASEAPIEAVQKLIHMQNLLAERKSAELIGEFSDDDFSSWPFWILGEAFSTRGQAYFAAKDGQAAEADLQHALTFTADERTRLGILRTVGWNRERNLEDDKAALEAYQEIADSTRFNGSAEFYYGVQGAARILTRQGKFDEALEILDRADAERLSGFWKGALLLSRGETLAAAGRTDEALVVYRKVLEEEQASDGQRKAAREVIQELKKD
jgi:tetratricopeptide (TPR) repeat protein